MDRHFRRLFNEQVPERLYDRYREDLSNRLGCPFEFRLAETPVFLSEDFKQKA